MTHSTMKSLSRFWSNRSAGKLVCGKGLEERSQFSPQDRLVEFRWHRDRDQKDHRTRLVSASDKITRTLSGAFAEWRDHNEHPRDVWIAFIYVPCTTTPALYHRAQDLEEAVGGSNPKLFKSEYIFDWEIQEEYVDHVVSLKTLLDRDITRYMGHQFDNTSELQETLKRNTQCRDVFDAGMYFAGLARCFGARAAVSHIARQLSLEAGFQTYRQKQDLWDGIDTSLIDFWLADIDFIINLQCHDEEVTWLRFEMQEEVDAFEDGVFWLMVDAVEGGAAVSEVTWERVERDRQLLLKKSISLEERIEEEAVKIWL